MTDLMIYAGSVEPDAPVTRLGGVPLVPAGFEWPRCAECEGPMQFLAHLALDDLAPDRRALAIFMCQNDPGLCDEWDPTSGANRALLLPSHGLTPAPAPTEGVTELEDVNAVELATVDEPDYDKARDDWATSTDRSPTDVLGQLRGTPSWIQADETPSCPSCTQPMTFTAQLEQGPDGQTGINFGGGRAYAFTCPSCEQDAFLGQC
jgi:hypothetical protein